MSPEQAQLESAIAALEGQRATLGDEVHLDQGDATVALQWHTQAQGVYETLKPSTAALNNPACVALCADQTRSARCGAVHGQPAAAGPAERRVGARGPSRDDHPALDLSAGAGGAG